MAKIGRNSLCPCGSGKKYKRCHGTAGQTPTGTALSTAALRLIEIQRALHDAKEYRRRLMQGLGRPILSSEYQGRRFVVVGSQLRWSKNWRTFQDFLLDYIKFVFTPEWGNAELKKDLAQRHSIMRWYQKLCDFQSVHATTRNEIHSGEMTGSVKAYLGLAYDLYLCAHNAHLMPLLVKRLKNPKTFEGALYETYVIGIFAKTGFQIAMEEEDDSSTAHCEFVATHLETGKKFSVEAKAVTSDSKRSGYSLEPPRIREKLYRALSKSLQHERIIFIDVNRGQKVEVGEVPDWVAAVDAEIVDAEKTLTISDSPAPPAYIFITNRAYLHNLDVPASAEVVFACGFKMDDFAPRGTKTILELVEARDHHMELYWLLRALEKHTDIPSTFDDKTSEEAFHNPDLSRRLQIGDKYPVQDEEGNIIDGVLYDAIVAVAHRKAYCSFLLANGRSVLIASRMRKKGFRTHVSRSDQKQLRTERCIRDCLALGIHSRSLYPIV